jgi:hypothetical protein
MGHSHEGVPGRGSLRPPAPVRCSARKLAAHSLPGRPPAYELGRPARRLSRPFVTFSPRGPTTARSCGASPLTFTPRPRAALMSAALISGSSPRTFSPLTLISGSSPQTFSPLTLISGSSPRMFSPLTLISGSSPRTFSPLTLISGSSPQTFSPLTLISGSSPQTFSPLTLISGSSPRTFSTLTPFDRPNRRGAASTSRGVAPEVSAQRACERSNERGRGAAGSSDPELVRACKTYGSPDPALVRTPYHVGSPDPALVHVSALELLIS